jgi:hypothetical protein
MRGVKEEKGLFEDKIEGEEGEMQEKSEGIHVEQRR